MKLIKFGKKHLNQNKLNKWNKIKKLISFLSIKIKTYKMF